MIITINKTITLIIDIDFHKDVSIINKYLNLDTQVDVLKIASDAKIVAVHGIDATANQPCWIIKATKVRTLKKSW